MNNQKPKTALILLIVAISIGLGTNIAVKKLGAAPSRPDITANLSIAENPTNEYVTIKFENVPSLPIYASEFGLLQNGFLVPIGKAVKTFIRGDIPEERPIALNAPSTIIINSGRSPIGISFQINKCSGFLQEFQTFNPPIEKRCPTAQEMLSGQMIKVPKMCESFFSEIPICTTIPENVPSICKSILIERVGYNQCVENFQSDADFFSNEWRLYLESGKTVWATTTPIEIVNLSDLN